MEELRSFDDLKPAPYNPRDISAEALSALKESLEAFGDISGIVWNSRSGHLVCGHQRLRALKEQWNDDLKMSPSAIETPDGERFPIRTVDWPEPKEEAANVAANSALLGGKFTVDVGALLDTIHSDLPDLSEALRIDELKADLPDFNPQPLHSVARLDQKKPITCPECGHVFTT